MPGGTGGPDETGDMDGGGDIGGGDIGGFIGGGPRAGGGDIGGLFGGAGDDDDEPGKAGSISARSTVDMADTVGAAGRNGGPLLLARDNLGVPAPPPPPPPPPPMTGRGAMPF